MISRRSWGNPDIPRVETRLLFLIGRRRCFLRNYSYPLKYYSGSKTDENMQKILEEENGKHNDLVQGDFLDTYHNLSYKAVMGYMWVAEFCSQADFVVKTDDDLFVDLYEVNISFTLQ